MCVGGCIWKQNIYLELKYLALKSQVIPTLYLNVCICICVCLGTVVPQTGHNLAALQGNGYINNDELIQ